jgi:hypothetical protein
MKRGSMGCLGSKICVEKIPKSWAFIRIQPWPRPAVVATELPGKVASSEDGMINL